MKKIISILTTFIFMLLIPMQVFAIGQPELTDAKPKKEVSHVSEYYFLKENKAKTYNQLKTDGFTEEQISKIRTIDYKAEMERRSRLDKESLKKMGYTENQIKEFKSFKGTEAQLAALSANVYIYSSFDHVDNGGRDYIIAYSWGWTSKPACQFTDIIGIGWEGGINGNKASSWLVNDSNNYCRVNYFAYPYGPMYPEVTSSGIQQAKATFAIFPQCEDAWAKSGSGTIHVRCTDPMTSMIMRFEYGHSTLTVKPSLSASGSGLSLSFSPSSITTTQDFSQHTYGPNGQI